MLKVKRVLETAIYCDDLARTVAFYSELLALAPMTESERVVSFDAGEGTVLLLFQRAESQQPVEIPGGIVPSHTGSGPAHLAFAIETTDIAQWLDRLAHLGIPVESRVTWGRGGRSIYFRDPDGHSVELATPGVWPSY